MKTVIKIDPFSKGSIDDAIEALEKYQEELELKCKQLLIILSQHGAEVAKVTVAGLPYSTGELENSIYAIYDEQTKTAMIKADSEHAVFVEFGTGLIGEGTYTNADYLALAEQFGWQGYYVGGEQGCEFKTKSGREGWITQMNNGQFFFTEGQTAKHFMDNAVKAVCEQYEDAVKKVFK